MSDIVIDQFDDERVFAPSRRRLTAGLVLTIVIVAFEGLAVSTIMPIAVLDLHGLALYAWSFSGFMLGSLVGTVASGEYADRSGPAYPFIGALAVFSCGLLACGTATSMLVFIAGRVIEGLGTGAVRSLVWLILRRTYPIRTQARMAAVLSSAWILPSLLGPTMAGVVARAWGWRVVFLALLPPGADGAGDVAAAAHTHRGRTGSGGFIGESRSDTAARGRRRIIYCGTAGEFNSMDCRAGHCRSCILVARLVPDSPGWNPPVPQRIARGARDARFADVRVLRSARVLSAGARDGARTIADDRGSRAVDRLNRMDLGIVDAGGMRLPFRFQRAAADHAIRPARAGDRYRRRGRYGGDTLSARRRDRRMGSRGPRDGYLLQHEHRALDPGRNRPFSRNGIFVDAVDRLARADAGRRVRGRGDDDRGVDVMGHISRHRCGVRTFRCGLCNRDGAHSAAAFRNAARVGDKVGGSWRLATWTPASVRMRDCAGQLAP